MAAAAPGRCHHDLFHAALAVVTAAIPLPWRRARVDRADLDRFLFEPGDIVLAVGQDGLVANLAKSDGVLAPHPPEAAGPLLRAVHRGRAAVQRRAMVAARLTASRSASPAAG